MEQGFRIEIVSNQEHEKVVAEIYRDDKFVALVSHEDEIPIVEIPGPGLDEAYISRTIPLQELRDALDAAVQRLNGDGQPPA